MPPERSVALALRARRLVEPGRRVDARARDPARAARRVAPRADARADADAQRRGPRRGRAELDDLARRLVAPHPPAVRGLAQVNLLVTDGTGPLYSGDGAASLVSAVRRARAALELV